MRRTPRFTHPFAPVLAAALLPGLLTVGLAQADPPRQAVIAVRLEVVPACTVTHASLVHVHCTPGTATPSVRVAADPAWPAPARPPAAWSEDLHALPRIDIVF